MGSIPSCLALIAYRVSIVLAGGYRLGLGIVAAVDDLGLNPTIHTGQPLP